MFLILGTRKITGQNTSYQLQIQDLYTYLTIL